MMIVINKSKDALLDVDNPAIVLNCTDIPLHHWLLDIQGLAIILNVNQCVSEPVVVIRNDKVFLGVEQGIFVINMKTFSIENAITDVANVQWIEDRASNQIIIAAEIEVVVFDNDGRMLWRKNLPDVIQTTDIVAEYLHITDMSGGEYNLNLVDGRIVDLGR